MDSITFEKEVIFENITFNREVNFSSLKFISSWKMDNIIFNDKSIFFEIYSSNDIVFKDVDGMEWVEGDELFCKLNINFDDRDNYIKLQKNTKVISIVENMKIKFPNEIKEIETYLSDFVFMGCYEYINKFSDITLECIKAKKFNQVQQHMTFILEVWNNADENTKHIIYDYYIENIEYGYRSYDSNEFNFIFRKWICNFSSLQQSQL